jgi:LmbE family N-acetylglucosaminyl deacetylase
VSWVFLSPHFDDVALSCGGVAWELAQRCTRVAIWTVCGGEVPEGELSPFAEALHARWHSGRDAPAQRKFEDLLSCERLGVSQRCFSVPDCIYRRDPSSQEFMYASETSLNGILQPGDFENIGVLQQEIHDNLERDATLVCPLGLGNHVDHQLTRITAEGLKRSLWYYADFPYVLNQREQLAQLEGNGWVSQVFTVSQAGLAAWMDSVAQHASQISTFWSSLNEMQQAIAGYWQEESGVRLWRKPG